MSPRNDATDSYLGFVFQGLYALILLLDAGDGDTVSVETQDDVALEGRELVLSQLKHSLGTPPDLRITNVGFWKTVRFWAEWLIADRERRPLHSPGTAAQIPSDSVTPSSSPSAEPPRPGTRFCFITVAAVGNDDALAKAVEGRARGAGDIASLVEALATEAQRVDDERAEARAAHEPLPHAERAAGCTAFLGLSPDERTRFVERLTILPGHFRITDIQAQVVARLRGRVRVATQERIAERLIEWWDRQVALALMGRRSRGITKEELSGAVHDIIAEHGTRTLPDDFSWRRPADEDLAAERGNNIERQIALVRGGEHRVDRALLARWRARAQRERWTGSDVSLAPILQKFDDQLKEAWAEKFGPMCDDCVGLGDHEVCRHGRDLVDWAHDDAPRQVPPPRVEWSQPFYAQGMLQQFADQLEVGWHPEFRQRLGEPESDAEDAGTRPATALPEAQSKLRRPPRSAVPTPAPPTKDLPPRVIARQSTSRRKRPEKPS